MPSPTENACLLGERSSSFSCLSNPFNFSLIMFSGLPVNPGIASDTSLHPAGRGESSALSGHVGLLKKHNDANSPEVIIHYSHSWHCSVLVNVAGKVSSSDSIETERALNGKARHVYIGLRCTSARLCPTVHANMPVCTVGTFNGASFFFFLH